MNKKVLINFILDKMKEFSAEDRLDVLFHIEEQYCPHCGYFHGDRDNKCQCWNDE